MSHGSRLGACAGVVVAGFVVLADGAPLAQPRDTQIFRAGGDLVQGTVTVRDADGRLVGELGRDEFEILEPTDEAVLVVFNHDPHLEEPWTTGPQRLQGRLDDVRPYGATAIYDAMDMALPLFASRAHARAALVLISDGSDTASDATSTDVRRAIRRSDAFVYAVGIDATEHRPINDRVNPRVLREITDESGGYTEVVHDSPEIAPATARIADELNHQYTFSYAPMRPADGTYRSIRLRVPGRDYRVRSRRGYVADPRPDAGPD